MAREMYAGQLNRRIKIRKWTDVPDSGMPTTTETYDEGITCWAKVEPVGSGVYYGSQQVGVLVTDRFVVRFRKNFVEAGLITGDHVVEYSGYRFHVKHTSEWEDSREFVLIETEKLGAISHVPAQTFDHTFDRTFR